MRVRFARIGTCALVAAGLAFAPTAGAWGAEGNSQGDNVVTLDLYNLTDVHGHIEQVLSKGTVKEAGLAAVGCYLDTAYAQNPNSALTLLGDNIGASPFTSGILYDNPTIAALNELQPKASTIGNHELDLGQDAFRARLNGTSATVNGKQVSFQKVGFRYLGANVEGLGTFADGRDYLGDWEIWESESGVKVAYIGAIAQDVPAKLSPGTTAGLVFNDPITRINSLAKELKTIHDGKRQADVVVAMLDDDVQKNITKMDPSVVDAIMGGDTHVPYFFNQNGPEGYQISGTASGSYTDNLGLIRVQLDAKTKQVLNTTTVRIPAADLAKCDISASATAQKITAIVDKAKQDSDQAGDEVVAWGLSPNLKFARAIVGEAGAGSNRGHESTLGDLVADSIKATVLDQKNQQPVDIGIINAGGMRADLQVNEKGQLTYKDTYAVQPFSNELGYVTITGQDFIEVLNQQWKAGLTTQNSRPMLKLGISSNVKYTYDPTLPMGSRITSVSVDGNPIDPDRLYTVGSVTFLLAGGDSFPALTKGGDYVSNGNLDRDLFNQYLRLNAAAITPNADRRSVGVTSLLNADNNLEVKLRGLGFTEGPGQVKSGDRVRLTLGSYSVEGAVDATLSETGLSEDDFNDPNAFVDKAPITTDGAGSAQLTIDARSFCSVNAASSSSAQPVSLQVLGSDGSQRDLSWALADLDFASQAKAALCTEVASDQVTDEASVVTDSNQSATNSTQKVSEKGKAKAKGKLARTGVETGTLAILGFSILALGAGLTLSLRKPSQNSSK